MQPDQPGLPGSEPYQLLHNRLQYQGRKYGYRVDRLRLPNGVEGDWEWIPHPGGALAVPLTNEGKLVCVRQYRFTVKGRLLEFPAGTIEPGEDPAATVRREIEEETGYRAHRWETLGQFYLAPGYSDEIIYAFAALDLELLEKPPAQDEDEDLVVELFTPEEMEAAILAGEPFDAKTITSFYLAQRFWR
ncbi:NUDIX hydrolase [Leptolyngbya sp. FACHB-261]|uniref:NUDIX hydrolase n=1 Tax=Leptolyngbya sp. FACHB-261 TaxID=2692806 RepID=UPI001683EB66|nr:NUDIX hydrolase [Leptolyngbya sp. FACHB-261]MBD2103551.1 NUDIX hydrolase [Leptolyngbya sp. FACHB-261]